MAQHLLFTTTTISSKVHSAHGMQLPCRCLYAVLVSFVSS